MLSTSQADPCSVAPRHRQAAAGRDGRQRGRLPLSHNGYRTNMPICAHNFRRRTHFDGWSASTVSGFMRGTGPGAFVARSLIAIRPPQAISRRHSKRVSRNARQVDSN